MKKLLLFTYVSFLSAVGLQGLGLEVNAKSLSHYGTGVAANIDVSINPATIMHDSPRVLSFSYNQWFDYVQGSMIKNEWKNQYISLHSYELNDIDLWGDNPDSTPLGTFGTHFVSFTYGFGRTYFNSLRLGLNIEGIHSRLYTATSKGIIFDIGFQYDISSKLHIGSAIKNIGYINSDLESNQLPSEYDIGFAYDIIKPISSVVMLDIGYNELKGSSFKLGINAKVKFLQFVAAINQYETNTYISTGFEFKYRRWSFIYGILSQEYKSLGTPQSFQLVWHY